MTRTIRINKLKISADYDKIDNCFDIYKITSDEKYIKYGAYVLDNPTGNIKAKSVCFLKGNSLFVLFDKDDVSISALLLSMRSNDDGKHLSVEKILSRDVYDNMLVQLFLNSLSNSQHAFLKYNNITGKLYCYHTDFISRAKKNGEEIIFQFYAVEVKITVDMHLTLKVNTFTNGVMKNKMTFGKKQFNDYPQYTFGENFALRRVLKDEKLGLNKVFIQRQYGKKHNTVPFMDITNYKMFQRSKMGILSQVTKLFSEKYADFITLNFDDITDFTELVIKKADVKLAQERINNTIQQCGINLVDEVKDSTSHLIINDLNAILVQEYNCKPTKRATLLKDTLNIRLIHNRDYYEGSNDDYMSDKKGFIIQHITVEDSGSTSKAMLDNHIKELAVKHDIQNRKISIINWSMLNYAGNVIFGLKYEDKFIFMTIKPDGTFDFNTMELDLFSMDNYAQYTKCFDTKGDCTQGIIVNADGEINIIRDTKMFTLPEFEQIGNELYLADKPFEIQCEPLIKYLDSIVDVKLHQLALVLIDKLQNRASISKEQLLKFTATQKNTKLREKINEFTFQEYGTPVRTYLRNSKKRNELLSSITDIKYFELPNGNKYYFVGSTGSGIQSSIDKGCIVREVSSYMNCTNFFDKLLPLMNVHFIRNGQLTVIPFPFKYLREYIDMEK